MSELGIAIPFFSGLGYLRRALESLLAQSTDSWRAVVVDDAGPDPQSGDLVRDFGDTRIRYVRNDENLGLAENWNLCLELASTDLVTLFHADDELGRDYVETILAVHQQNPDAVAVYTAAEVIGPDSARMFSFPDAMKRFTGFRRGSRFVTVGDNGLAAMLRGQFIFCPALSYKRHLLPSRPFDAEWRQVLDLDLIARLLFDGHRIVGVPDRAYRYRRHSESQTALLTSTCQRFREELDLYDEITKRAEERGWPRSAAVARRARIVRAHVLYRVLLSALRGDLNESRVTASLLRTRGSR